MNTRRIEQLGVGPLREEIAKIHAREVPLPDGGSIVIDQTEALVAIDVNSGSFRTDDSAEESAYRLNIAAAKEISRQLRLRDLGGVIVSWNPAAEKMLGFSADEAIGRSV